MVRLWLIKYENFRKESKVICLIFLPHHVQRRFANSRLWWSQSLCQLQIYTQFQTDLEIWSNGLIFLLFLLGSRESVDQTLLLSLNTKSCPRIPYIDSGLLSSSPSRIMIIPPNYSLLLKSLTSASRLQTTYKGSWQPAW